jgi:hypothetical protein
MTRSRLITLFAGTLIISAVPIVASAQPSPRAAAEPASAESSNLWFTAGAAFAAFRADCQTCEDDFPYRHSAAVIGNGGYRVSPRLDVGAELLWLSTETASGRARITHLDAVAQFRPWTGQGFFIKGGAGMAFLRNWVDAVGPSAINQKALSVVIGAGWVFRREQRVGFQIVGAQHAGALGDVKTATADVGDVMSNFWSVGAAIVLR